MFYHGSHIGSGWQITLKTYWLRPKRFVKRDNGHTIEQCSLPYYGKYAIVLWAWYNDVLLSLWYKGRNRGELFTVIKQRRGSSSCLRPPSPPPWTAEWCSRWWEDPGKEEEEEGIRDGLFHISTDFHLSNVYSDTNGNLTSRFYIQLIITLLLGYSIQHGLKTCIHSKCYDLKGTDVTNIESY